MKKLKKKKMLGRKSKNSENKKCGHDKFADDNLIRKIKCTLLEVITLYINSILKLIYKDDKGKNKKELLKMNQGQIVSSKADYNREFMNKPLKVILSDNISTKYTRYDPKHNKCLIEELLNDKDEEVKMIFEKIFNLTFLDCLQHFRGSKYIGILDGLTKMDEVLVKFQNDPNYVTKFKLYVKEFETIIDIKKGRNRGKKSQYKERKTIEIDENELKELILKYLNQKC